MGILTIAVSGCMSAADTAWARLLRACMMKLAMVSSAMCTDDAMAGPAAVQLASRAGQDQKVWG